jgi:hypothetical protein
MFSGCQKRLSERSGVQPRESESGVAQHRHGGLRDVDGRKITAGNDPAVSTGDD